MKTIRNYLFRILLYYSVLIYKWQSYVLHKKQSTDVIIVNIFTIFFLQTLKLFLFLYNLTIELLLIFFKKSYPNVTTPKKWYQFSQQLWFAAHSAFLPDASGISICILYFATVLLDICTPSSSSFFTSFWSLSGFFLSSF